MQIKAGSSGEIECLVNIQEISLVIGSPSDREDLIVACGVVDGFLF
jgi:hypothetical protein